MADTFLEPLTVDEPVTADAKHRSLLRRYERLSQVLQTCVCETVNGYSGRGVRVTNNADRLEIRFVASTQVNAAIIARIDQRARSMIMAEIGPYALLGHSLDEAGVNRLTARLEPTWLYWYGEKFP